MSKRSLDLVQRVDFLRESARGKSVLHLGCTNWPYFEQTSGKEMFLHSALLSEASELWGVDGDQQGIDQMTSVGIENLYVGDLEKLGDLPIARTFDVIIAGEVIEHLSNPGLMLSGLRRFMAPHTKLIITTINGYGAHRFAVYGLRGRGGTAEPVHPDHVAYYSYRTLDLIGRRSGLTMEKFMFYDIGPEHRPHMRASLRLINDVAVRFMPQLADGIIGVFTLEAEA